MKDRAMVISLACFLSILMVSVSCATAPQTPAAAPTSGAAPASGAAPTSVKAAEADAPKYGGTLVSVLNSDPTNFDSGSKGQGGANYGLVYQQYLTTDWTKGPAGGGSMDYYVNGNSYIEDLYYPQVAESWKMPSVGVWVLQIRKGMRWQKVDSEAGRLMGGREVTTDEVVASLKRLLTAPQSWANVGQPAMAKATTIEKTGDWEVTVKTPVDYLTSFYWIIQGGGFNALYPPAVVEKYGDVADWHNSVGTGPFMLTDYVRGSSLTFVKNPDYWETDPVGPGKGNKLPYVDQYRQLIIPDVSSRMAAMRTAKIDMWTDATKEDAQSILKENSKMQYQQYMVSSGPNSSYFIAMRTDKQGLPFKDKRVRQAMMLATDFNALKQTLFGGEAEIDTFPVNKQIKSLFKPISELPAPVQDLYKYNPDKAKQLLKEAGYPNGFKTTVVTDSNPQLVDELTVYKNMWAKVGIDLVIDARETTAFTALLNARGNDELIYRSLMTAVQGALYFTYYRGKSTNNPSYINDPEGSIPDIENTFNEINKNVFTDWPKAYDTFKQMKPFLLENAYMIPRPTPFVDTLWWPWVKNYYGSQTTGFVRYAWIDQDLKKSMGH